MEETESEYFTTISGSNTLAMLASFEAGRDVIFDIIQTKKLPISLFSYVRKNAATEEQGIPVNRNENALTILIEKLDYNLYELLFNRLVFHSRELGIGSFSAITDTLLFLQDRGDEGNFVSGQTCDCIYVLIFLQICYEEVFKNYRSCKLIGVINQS